MHHKITNEAIDSMAVITNLNYNRNRVSNSNPDNIIWIGYVVTVVNKYKLVCYFVSNLPVPERGSVNS